MSRCFPFPPPGYKLNGIRDEVALIESIKIAEEKAKKELKRRERKREKKEKKEKKKRKERERKDGESEKHKHSHKKRRKEEEGPKAKDGHNNNQKVDPFRKLSEMDCLEKSTLTVERELVQSTSQNSCDSTVNSNEIPKQKLPMDGRYNSNEILKEKQKQPLDVRHNNNNNNNNNDSESIIRIRLPIRRQKDPDVMLSNKDQQKPRGIKLDHQPVTQNPCSTSTPPDHTSKLHEEKKKDVTFTMLGKEKKISSFSTPDHTSKPLEEKEKRKDPKLGKEKKRSSSSSTTLDTTYQPSRLCSICPPSMALQFLNVVENWVPNTIERRVEELTSSEGEDCLWFLKKPTSSNTERCNQVNRNSNETKQVISGSMAWPCARLLPEADVHALPYTVPF